MDLNELFQRHQISLERAANAASVEARHAHLELANGYARRIQEAQTMAPQKVAPQTIAPQPVPRQSGGGGMRA
ncbi:hypothetical protein SAMN05428950_10430 [Sphingomonas sp. OV641]|uniref:hypothetical protein n=1 Tax=Sphingomonas sp. OV641 TaxID=1881068 RepID=UPI0008B41C34|nr:hypothetical protein [Sphingomonas sp. OV641]SEJ86482.1 hypothetical protein SAMN05428950_10430 [Sphingomonas sp. OV641]